jgi:hypothetical protein
VAAAAVLSGAAGATAVGLTRPFTWQADLLTAAGIAGILIAGVVTTRRARPGRLPPGDGRARSGPPAPAGASRRAAIAWAAAAVSVVTLELVSLLSQPRRTHPTGSYYLGLLSGHGFGKAALFAVWLAAGWWIWRSGSVPPGASEDP